MRGGATSTRAEPRREAPIAWVRLDENTTSTDPSVRALREALEGIPESVADRYAAEASAHAIREDLAATIKAALTAAADAIARGPLG